MSLTSIQQIKWWFYNDSKRQKKGGGKKQEKVDLKLDAPKPRKMQDWQGYLSLFAEEIADGFDERYEAYKATVKKPKGRWWFTMHTAKERLAAAPEDVKRQVEDRRDDALAAAAGGISLLDKDGNPLSTTVAQEKAFELQR